MNVSTSSTPEPAKPLKVFIAYAHQDNALLKEFVEKWLWPLKRVGLITDWHDQEILPGGDWQSEIDEHLNTAQVILLLISQDFIASEYCYSFQVMQAMERHKAKTARVIPIILRHADWENTPIKTLQALPRDGNPISERANHDKAFKEVTQEIRKAVEELAQKPSDKKTRQLEDEDGPQSPPPDDQTQLALPPVLVPSPAVPISALDTFAEESPSSSNPLLKESSSASNVTPVASSISNPLTVMNPPTASSTPAVFTSTQDLSPVSVPPILSTTSAISPSASNQAQAASPSTQSQPSAPNSTKPIQPTTVPTSPLSAPINGPTSGTKVKRGNVGRKRFLIIVSAALVVLLIFLMLTAIWSHIFIPKPPSCTLMANRTPSLPSITTASNGEPIGISEGAVVFDTNRSDGALKDQAAGKLKAGDICDAKALWQSAHQQDTSDAEALIYLEDQRVLTSQHPYITLVIATTFTPDNVSVGRDDLQGAYVEQKEHNDYVEHHDGILVRLLVASSSTTNSSNEALYAPILAGQIVQAAQKDKTIVDVMGWPTSQSSLNAINVLAPQHIPIVSQTASSDALTGVSSYFFRVAPPDKQQGGAGAQYAEQTLHAKKIALFFDPTNSYSKSLANAFKKQFLADGNGDTIVVTENYTVGPQGRKRLSILLQDALHHNPDLIYFTGYSSDVGEILANLPTSGPFANLQVMGGNALYDLKADPSCARIGFDRLHFTAFAYPDEWSSLSSSIQKLTFFSEYSQDFGPKPKNVCSPYGYTRADDNVMLSYDATFALLTASKMALQAAGGKNVTPEEVQQALTQITGAQTLQGVSGPIAFGSDGDPINKPFVVLAVDTLRRIHEERLEGCLLVGPCS